MRLGLMLSYAPGRRMELPLAQAADRLGLYAVLTAEAYGSDALTPLAWLGAPADPYGPVTTMNLIVGDVPTLEAIVDLM